DCMSVGEQPQKTRRQQLCCGGTPGCHALVDLLDPFLSLSLVRKCPAAQNSTVCHPERKSLFRGKADGGFSTFLGETHLTTELMVHSSTGQDQTQAKRVCNLLGAGHRLLALRSPLVRIAQTPQCPGSKAMANHPSVLAIEERRSTVLLGIVERYTLRKGCVRIGYRAQVEQRRSQGTVRRHEHGSVLDLVCQGQELLAQYLRRLELGTLAMIVHKPTQHRETLVRLFQMFTELPSVGVCLANFASSVAFHGK